MRKFVLRMAACITAIALLLNAGFCLAEKDAGDLTRLAGNYICFEESNGLIRAALKQGVITISDGMIASIEPIGENLDGVVLLDDECVIFPGLIDLHSHVEFNSLQLWEGSENDAPWDNRFEWRRSAKYVADLRDKQNAFWSRWEEPFGESGALTGDLIEYFVEAQAAAGGTTLIQGYNQTEDYDTADSHEKVDLIRGTCFSDDLGVAEGDELQCLIQVFKPDVVFDTEAPETYLPPIDTAQWHETLQQSEDGETDCLSLILDSIRNGTSCGWLIHMAEGRAGNLLPEVDPYSRLEYTRFRDAILSAIDSGDFTAEDVRSAHIVLIHACGIDLDVPEDYAFIRDCGIGLIWSPVSNLMLYTDTPAFYNYLGDDALLVGIGSDWSPSGSKTVWDECKLAFDFMQKHADDPSDAAENLLRACTLNAALMIGHAEAGNIKVGGFADLFVLRGSQAVKGSRDTALNTFIETGDDGVEAVIADGETVYASFDFLSSAYDGEIPASYGRYETEKPGLEDKYFLVPPLFNGYTFDALYQAYAEIIQDAQGDLSLLRNAEDADYNRFMNELREKYCR